MARVKQVKPFKFKTRRGNWKFPAPSQPRFGMEEDDEMLLGEVNGLKASAPEERLARALDKAEFQYIFRYVVGAPKGMPGWKELDFVIFSGGILHPLEVDTAFTHRGKAAKDILHDAIVMNDRELNSMGRLAPQVKRADGDSELSTMKLADAYVKRTFGKPSPQYEALPEFDFPALGSEYQQSFSQNEPSKASAKKKEEFDKKKQENNIKAILEQQQKDKKKNVKVTTKPPRKAR